MPTITRSYSVEYGSTVIGGASDKFLLRKRGFGVFENYRKARLTFEVIVTGGSTTAFRDNQIELLDAFRTPRQRLQVKTPDGLRDFNPSSSVNTGFDAEPQIELVPGRVNGPLFRNYRCSVTVSLPADLSGQAGRRDNDVATNTQSNNRDEIVLRGVYTALTTNDATAQYNAQIATYATSVLPAGSWQYVRQSITRNDTDKIVTFSRLYREITHNQGNGVADHASVKEQEITISQNETGATNSFVFGRVAKPYASYSVRYRVIIDKDVTPSTGLKALYDSELKAKMLADIGAQMRAIGGGSLDRDAVDLDLENNVITAIYEYRTKNGSNVIESRMTKTLISQTGISLIPVTTGLPHHYARDEGPPKTDLNVVITEKISSGTFSEFKTPKGFELIRKSESAVQLEEGKFPNTIRTKTKTTTYDFQFAKIYKGGSGGGSVTRSKPPKTITSFSGQGV